jgi:tetratricopeptide (TPR) repeat protein
MQKPSEATEDLSKAIVLDPKNATAKNYYDLAKNLVLVKQYDAAIQNFDKSLKLDSSSGLAYANRGIAYLNKGDQVKAVNDFRKALTLLKEPARIATVDKLLKDTEQKIQITRMEEQKRRLIEAQTPAYSPFW